MSAHVFKLSLLKVFALLNTSEGSYSVSLTLLSFGHYLKACVIGQIIAYIHVIVYSKWVQVIIWTADCKLLLELNYLYGSHARRICPTVYVTNTTWGIKGRVNLLGSSRNWSTSVLHFCYLCQSLPFVWTLVAVRGKSVINGSLSWPLEETLFFYWPHGKESFHPGLSQRDCLEIVYGVRVLLLRFSVICCYHTFWTVQCNLADLFS